MSDQSAPLQVFITFVNAETKRRGLALSTPPQVGVHPNYRLVSAAQRGVEMK
jgi:hypothetical protein